MRLLVIGSGARKNSMAARLPRGCGASRPGVIVAAPGNPGMTSIARTVSVEASDISALLELARRDQIDLTIVGPEVPLSLGIADRFAQEGLAILGPTQAAARLESSKAFAKAFMTRHGVPTARFETVESLDAAIAFVRAATFGFPIVLKADGLAAGKGVVIADDLAAAERAIREMMADRKFGAAGDRLVIEECLRGPEVSFFALCDGTRTLPLGTAQDHKRVFDDDHGPNTGGMGAFAPSPLADTALHRRVMSEIVEPVIAGMAAEGDPSGGFL